MAARSVIFGVSLAGVAMVALLAGCSSDYSPNTYNSNAVQQANKADQGVVVGVRQVDVSASGATGAVVGGAAGGIAGSQVGGGTTSAFGALGGSLVGGLIGIGAEHAAGDTTAYEYVVRKTNKELVSVTQKGDPPLAIGQHVLVIAGVQARIVPDYTVSLPPETPEASKESTVQPVQQTPLAAPPAASAAPAAAPAEAAIPVPAVAPPAAAEVTKAIEAPAAPAPVVPVQPAATPGVPTNLVPALVTPAAPSKPD
jgi:outer membrane lipoprotein SlyB